MKDLTPSFCVYTSMNDLTPSLCVYTSMKDLTPSLCDPFVVTPSLRQ